jgi:C1A family cysteine protease
VPAGTYADLGAVPSSFNWCDENGCTPIKNQGTCGACWAFSAVATFESIIKINDGYDSDLSEQYLLQCNSDNWSCQGGMWAHDYHECKTVSGQSEAGAVLESDLPYVGHKTGAADRIIARRTKLIPGHMSAAVSRAHLAPMISNKPYTTMVRCL